MSITSEPVLQSCLIPCSMTPMRRKAQLPAFSRAFSSIVKVRRFESPSMELHDNVSVMSIRYAHDLGGGALPCQEGT